ncbi:DUF1365 domain-containing protein [Paraferrimonas haliotis]|uniref:DUF1365 domain-containing protein n=1 Tax=Paraferrimonas haliotis TaxID=2013866 RepID=A0AA37WYD5_9GAMM|nr:DUF1365 domain-containing protein [Paraferrimonas haliotis]GLS83720.1 DUF1365 domain-containing protein [Paraferrimonas haliotis]
MNSAIYQGWVRHRRFTPKQHHFRYQMFLLAVDLDELESLNRLSPWLKLDRFAPLSLHKQDYLDGEGLSKVAALNKVNQLGGEGVQRVMFVGQPRCFGLYFSPINMYYCYDEQDQLKYLLAEVSNTPWNQRHYYLVDAPNESATSANDKAFHVSPFMPLEMQYRWRFSAPNKQLALHLENWQQHKVFDATLNLKRSDLNKATVRNTIIKLPSMALKTVAAIYWQALKIWLKRVPFIPHPNQ